MAPPGAKSVPKSTQNASKMEAKMTQNLGLLKSGKFQPLQCETDVFDDVSRTKMTKKWTSQLTCNLSAKKNLHFPLWAGPVTQK